MLKPCPCCGGEAKLMHTGSLTDWTHSYVKCTECGLATKIFPKSCSYCADDEASMNWNNRVKEEVEETQ